jgi:DNA end-binding protein Ku
MRAIWKGTISFGLVSIPISLYPATKREELKFNLLRKSDMSPINYKRIAELDGKEVPWDQIVKGYEYEKGKYVVIREEDFKRVDVEATQTVDIINFVELKKINPLLFYKPYYMEPGKGGDKAYVLLRDALARSEKIGIAKVVIRVRQHLAAIKTQKDGLMLELMHFPDELRDLKDFKVPGAKNASKPEMNMATQLIESMTTDWDPTMYHDDYHEALEKLIEDRVSHGDKELPPARRAKSPTKAVDLVAILQRSIQQTRTKSGRPLIKEKKTVKKGERNKGPERRSKRPDVDGHFHRN